MNDSKFHSEDYRLGYRKGVEYSTDVYKGLVNSLEDVLAEIRADLGTAMVIALDTARLGEITDRDSAKLHEINEKYADADSPHKSTKSRGE